MGMPPNHRSMRIRRIGTTAGRRPEARRSDPKPLEILFTSYNARTDTRRYPVLVFIFFGIITENCMQLS
jgi:hypothetical protein